MKIIIRMHSSDNQCSRSSAFGEMGIRVGENQRNKERFREKVAPKSGLEGGIGTAKRRKCQMRNT